MAFQGIIYGQKKADHPNSPAYKDYKPRDTSTIFRRNDESLKLWQSYFLIKEANEGNPFAQHELGIRYLTGKGFTPDTLKGFYWINLAAEKDVPSAHFNLAILYNNGWGTEWNPFQAFRSFEKAAKGNMTDAFYVVGLFYTDNLVVPRNMEKAYIYIKKAADKGYKPAKEILAEFWRKGLVPVQYRNSKDTLSSATKEAPYKPEIEIDPSIGINYLDLADTTENVNEYTLLRDVLKDAGDELRNAFGSRLPDDTTFKADKSTMKLIISAAEQGSPEAILLLGKCYEKGIGVERDPVKAAAEYIRAVRHASPKAPRVLYSFLGCEKNFTSLLKNRIQKGNADAEYVWALLTALRFDQSITGEDALRLLKKAAERGHIPAMIEMGLCYYTGNLVKEDKDKAIKIWKKLSRSGNIEAAVRLAVVDVQEGFIYSSAGEAIEILRDASEHGSLLAQMALAKCYEEGRGVKQNKPEAIYYYRLAAQRGSIGAYHALKQMYNEIRPNEEEFIVIEDD